MILVIILYLRFIQETFSSPYIRLLDGDPAATRQLKKHPPPWHILAPHRKSHQKTHASSIDSQPQKQLNYAKVPSHFFFFPFRQCIPIFPSVPKDRDPPIFPDLFQTDDRRNQSSFAIPFSRPLFRRTERKPFPDQGLLGGVRDTPFPNVLVAFPFVLSRGQDEIKATKQVCHAKGKDRRYERQPPNVVITSKCTVLMPHSFMLNENWITKQKWKAITTENTPETKRQCSERNRVFAIDGKDVRQTYRR